MKYMKNEGPFRSYMENTGVKSEGARDNYVSWLKSLLDYDSNMDENLDDEKIEHFIENLRDTESKREKHKGAKDYGNFRSVLRKYKDFLDSEINENVNSILISHDADTLSDIQNLEKKMSGLTPKVKQRISNFIERGTIAFKVKKLMEYKCLICKALKVEDEFSSFQKNDGKRYVETHHVEPVSNLKTGALGLSNLLTVCANHHRQLHYGKVERLDNDENEYFLFKIDDKELKVDKIKIP